MEFQQDRFFKPHVTDAPTIAQSSDEHEGNEVEEIEKNKMKQVPAQLLYSMH